MALIQQVQVDDGSLNNIASTAYGTCSTAAGTQAKAVTIDGFTLLTGTTIHVLFTNGNTIANPTLNVSSTGAKQLRWYNNQANNALLWQPGALLTLTYDGNYWQVSTPSYGDIGNYGNPVYIDNGVPNLINYLGIHPERGTPITMPFLWNDLAHLERRGGSYRFYYTTATTFTAETINATNINLDLTAAFNAQSNYIGINRPQDETTVIDITSPITITYSSAIYIDFGSSSWSPKQIKILVKHTSENTYTQKYDSGTGFASGACNIRTSHTWTDSNNATQNSFNQIRIVFLGWNSAQNRIAQIGAFSHGSSGPSVGYMSRGTDDEVWRSISPAAAASYNLGTSAHPWSTVYSDVLNSLLIGTGTAAQDKGANASPRYFPTLWKFNVGRNAQDGDLFLIKMPTVGHTYGVCMSVDDGAHYYPIILNDTARMTTQYPIHTHLWVTFESSGVATSMTPPEGAASINGSTLRNGAFRVLNYYDSNSTTISNLYQGNGHYQAANQIYRYQLLFEVTDNTLCALTSTNNTTATSKTMLIDQLFKLNGKIFYYSGTGNVSEGSIISAGSLTYAYPLDLRYSFNIATNTLTSNKAVYLKVIADNDGMCHITATDSTVITQTLPTSNDGVYYIYLGRAYNGYCIMLDRDHPVYAYDTKLYTVESNKKIVGNLIGNTVGSLGTTAAPFHNLVLGGTTNNVMTKDSANPRITFQEGAGTQPVHLIYTDLDSYRNPAGLKIVGGTSATPAWFEVEGDLWVGTTTQGSIGINQTNGTSAEGISLYGGAGNVATYGLYFGKTSSYGTFGDVSSDWATYFSMSRHDTRGWIFKSNTGTAGNYASISGRGHFTGSLTPSSWIDGQRYYTAAYNIADYSNKSSYNPWMRATNTWTTGEEDAKIGRWFSFGTLGPSFYWGGSETTRTANSMQHSMNYNISNGQLIVDGIIKSNTGFADHYNGTATKLAYSQPGLAASAITWLACWNGYELRAMSKAEVFNAVRDNGGDSRWVNVAGDTMEGVLTLKGEQYSGPGGAYGLNANNSDIVNVNGIFTRDLADTFGEGYMFYRDASHWDGFAAKSGIFYFGSNLATYNAALTGNATIHAGRLDLYPGSNSNWSEGIRIHAATNGWATIALCGTDNTGDSNTSANTWSIHMNGGNFYIARNGSSSSSSAILKCVDNVWSLSGTVSASISGNAATATKLATARNINGTAFDGSANITTANWGTARTLTIGNKGQSVNGSANVSWALQDILIRASNEFDFTADGISAIHFNHKTQTGTVATTLIKDYYFKNGNGATTGVTIHAASFSGNAATASKISAALNQTTKTYLLGTISALAATAANVSLTGDSGVYLTTTAGELSAYRYSWHYGTTERAYSAWNDSDECIDFIFA